MVKAIYKGSWDLITSLIVNSNYVRNPKKKKNTETLFPVEILIIYHCLPEPSGPPANIIKRGIILAVDYPINKKESELPVLINLKNDTNQNMLYDILC